MLREISGEREVQRPSQRDTQLLLEGGQLRKIDRPPQPPREEAGQAQAKNVRHPGVMPDRRELAEGRKAERCFP